VRCPGEADWPQPLQGSEIVGDMIFRKRRPSGEEAQMDERTDRFRAAGDSPGDTEGQISMDAPSLFDAHCLVAGALER
jgi:hypothetical protein